MRQTRFLSHINKIGIFASSLLLTVTAVYLYSPILGSHAGDGVTTRFEVVINPVASITLDTSDLVFDIAPTASGTFSSSPITATVSTNSLGGYELYFSSDDDETDMIHDDAGISDVIASDFSGTVTSETMGANKWGYSLDNVDFLKIPTATNQLELRNIDHYPAAAEKTNTVYIGTKISTALTSGLYSKDVKFTAVAHDNPVPSWDISNMQDMTPAICEAATIGTTGTLTDTRDGNTYTVTKLNDGKCWMTENLRIAGKTITSADSNVASDFTIPASSVSGFSAQDTNNAYVDSTYGGYYTFYTATAGTGGTSLATDGANAPSSICPKGWRLPTGGSSGEFNTLYGQYNSAALMMGVPNFTLSGHVYNGSMNGQGSYGYFWSSTVYGAINAYVLYLNSSNVYPANHNSKVIGFSVRCIAREPYETMQAFDKTTLANTGDSKTLQDVRDGNLYTVKKLADGNVWMTQNLRIINKQLDSELSDLPENETYTVPASDITKFSNSYDAAYLDSTTNSGHYNYQTATAGYDIYSSSGESNKSICPKGWRLPTGNTGGEFEKLYEKYPSLSAMQGEPNFVLSGSVLNGSINLAITRYFSSTAMDYAYKYGLSISSSNSSVSPSAVFPSHYSNSGAVRCIAR